jgi:beta-glucosidase
MNSNPANAVINTDSFGVSGLAEAYIRGAHEEDVLVMAKHFPGHGESSVDSHHGVTVVGSDLAHLGKFDFPPFATHFSGGYHSPSGRMRVL